jgi:serpin B
MKIRTLLLLFQFVATFDSGAGTSIPAATNALGLDLYRLESTGEQAGNLLLSPYSIQSALAMTLEGADGGTREEMSRILHLESDAGKPGEQFATLRQALEKAASDSQKRLEGIKKEGGSFEPLQLRVANRLFGQTSYPFRAEFLKRTQDIWQAPLEKTAFNDPEGARKHINDWVEQQTAKRIVNLLPDRAVSATTRMVLVNALYFKAAWESDFKEQATKALPFFVGGKTSVNVPTMLRQAHFGYRKESGFAAATLAYTGGELQFLIILPDANDGLPAVEKSLTAEKLTNLAILPGDREVQMYLPKFKIESLTLPLAKDLKSLGMKTAFDDPPGSADFSRMGPRSPQEYLCISEVFHKAFLALDEKGTEAAAATAVAMLAPTSAVRDEKPVPIEFRVNHPFLFAIQHRVSGTCLFLGRVNDPR